MIPDQLDRARGSLKVAALLRLSPPRFFAAVGELDWYSRNHRQWIDDLEIRAGGHVLDIGCAAGALTAYLTDSGYSATGLDRSADMIRRARDAHPHTDFSVGDATALPYDDNTFDAVLAASVINVVPDPTAVLSEMRRVCRPGGTVSVLLPSAEFTAEDRDNLIETLGLTAFSRAALTKWYRTAPKTSESQLEILLRSVDLDPAETCTYLGGMLLAATTTTRPS